MTPGDGNADVVVLGGGTARWHAGSAAGLVAVPGWTQAGVPGGAGDTDGDGFDDVLVGGRLYPGGAAGPAATSSWSSAGLVVGDLSGDGLADLVAPEPGWSDGTVPAEGRVLAYLGAVPTPVGPVREERGGEWLGLFGQRVAGLGDVDGDGRDEVFLGSAEAGWIAAGSPFCGWEGAFWCDSFGECDNPRAAGDVNDDGLADVIVATPCTDRAWLAFGQPRPSSPPASDGRDGRRPLRVLRTARDRVTATREPALERGALVAGPLEGLRTAGVESADWVWVPFADTLSLSVWTLTGNRWLLAAETGGCAHVGPLGSDSLGQPRPEPPVCP